MTKFLFIDPASRSTGWAYSEDGLLIEHGTIASKLPTVYARLSAIHFNYVELVRRTKPDIVVFERMNYKVHHFVLYSIGTIMEACSSHSEVLEFKEQSPGTWKKYLKKCGRTLEKNQELHGCGSEDEAVAVAMYLAHFNVGGIK
jgi:Holliday junction resolvasome RuvABC endonuclease subunit